MKKFAMSLLVSLLCLALPISAFEGGKDSFVMGFKFDDSQSAARNKIKKAIFRIIPFGSGRCY